MGFRSLGFRGLGFLGWENLSLSRPNFRSFSPKPRRLRGPPGFHTTAGELQTCTFEGSGASNTTKIRREDTQRDTKRAKRWRGKGRKRAKFWASHPSGPRLSGVCSSMLCFFILLFLFHKKSQRLQHQFWLKSVWPKSAN